MLARLWDFLPSFLVVFALVYASKRYILFIFRKTKGHLFGHNVIDVAFSGCDGLYSNSEFYKLRIHIVLVFFPSLEELIFRFPIIFFFKELNVYSLIFIVLSAILFSLLHYNQCARRWSRFILVVATFIVGVLAGYLGVKYQSLYVAVLVHFVWNFSAGFLLVEILYRLSNVIPENVLKALRSV